MTTNYPTSPGTTAGSTSSSGAKEKAQQTAGTAADESKHVAGVAKDEASQVAGEAKQQAKGLLDEAKTQVDEQSRTQRDRLVGTLQEFSSSLESMANGEGNPSGMAQDMVRQVADRARTLSSSMDGREPTDLLEDVRSFARRKPGTFLLGAMAAGLVAGRVTRGAKQANSSSGSSYGDPRGAAAGYPATGTPTGTGYSATEPVYPSAGIGTETTYVAPGTVETDPLDPTLGSTGGVRQSTSADTPWTDNPSNRGPL